VIEKQRNSSPRTEGSLAGPRGGSVGKAMSTRFLILAALLCGLAILVAFALQVAIA
jgi:hypothetical protein